MDDMGGEKMSIKIKTILIVMILIIFGIGYSLGSYEYDNPDPSIQVFSDTLFGKVPLNVSFTSKIFNVEEKIDRYLWDFNDGTQSNKQSVIHTFFREGVFNVTLTIWDVNGNRLSDSIQITVFEYYKPIALASANNTCGKAPLLIQFNAEYYDIDKETGKEESYIFKWDFDDGTTSNKKNPKHTFNEVGTYNVRLTIFDSDGQEDTNTIQVTVIDDYYPIASASADIVDGKAPLTVKFTGECTDIDGTNPTFHWKFENTIIPENSESTEKNPSHTFWFPGTYRVRLTVEDEDENNDTDIIIINVTKSGFSNSVNWFIEKTKEHFIKGAIGSFIGNFVGTFLGKVSGNLLAFFLKICMNENNK